MEPWIVHLWQSRVHLTGEEHFWLWAVMMAELLYGIFWPVALPRSSVPMSIQCALSGQIWYKHESCSKCNHFLPVTFHIVGKSLCKNSWIVFYFATLPRTCQSPDLFLWLNLHCSWSRAGYKLVSVSTDNNVCIWDVLNGECDVKYRFPSPVMKVSNEVLYVLMKMLQITEYTKWER